MQNLIIGRHCYGKPKVFSWNNENHAEIGNFCSIADEVSIFLGGNHFVDYVTTYPFGANKWPEEKDFRGQCLHKSKGDVKIGSDVWISSKVTILSGVCIGHGAVIGNSAVVAKDVPPYAIVVGNPAKIIKLRFTELQIQKLLKISWWNWSDEKITKFIPYLLNIDIENFISLTNELESLNE